MLASFKLLAMVFGACHGSDFRQPYPSTMVTLNGFTAGVSNPPSQSSSMTKISGVVPELTTALGPEAALVCQNEGTSKKGSNGECIVMYTQHDKTLNGSKILNTAGTPPGTSTNQAPDSDYPWPTGARRQSFGIIDRDRDLKIDFFTTKGVVQFERLRDNVMLSCYGTYVGNYPKVHCRALVWNPVSKTTEKGATLELDPGQTVRLTRMTDNCAIVCYELWLNFNEYKATCRSVCSLSGNSTLTKGAQAALHDGRVAFEVKVQQYSKGSLKSHYLPSNDLHVLAANQRKYLWNSMIFTGLSATNAVACYRNGVKTLTPEGSQQRESSCNLLTLATDGSITVGTRQQYIFVTVGGLRKDGAIRDGTQLVRVSDTVAILHEFHETEEVARFTAFFVVKNSTGSWLSQGLRAGNHQYKFNTYGGWPRAYQYRTELGDPPFAYDMESPTTWRKRQPVIRLSDTSVLTCFNKFEVPSNSRRRRRNAQKGTAHCRVTVVNVTARTMTQSGDIQVSDLNAINRVQPESIMNFQTKLWQITFTHNDFPTYDAFGDGKVVVCNDQGNIGEANTVKWSGDELGWDCRVVTKTGPLATDVVVGKKSTMAASTDTGYTGYWNYRRRRHLGGHRRRSTFAVQTYDEIYRVVDSVNNGGDAEASNPLGEIEGALRRRTAIVRGLSSSTGYLNIGPLNFHIDLTPEPATTTSTTTRTAITTTTSEVPTTQVPTTAAPTTPVPTTQAPTMQAPTTQAPTTLAPTTQAPTQGPTQAPTTAAPTTAAPTTQAPTTQGPTTSAGTTTTTTAAAATFSGSLSFTAANLTKAQVEAAAKASLATHLEVDPSAVTVTGTKTRRLEESTVRRLSDAWTVAYTVSAPTTQMAALQTKATTVSSNFASFANTMKTELVNAGANPAAASITISSFSGKSDTPTATAMPETASDAWQFALGVSATILALGINEFSMQISM